jgi:hypothetical protein
LIDLLAVMVFQAVIEGDKKSRRSGIFLAKRGDKPCYFRLIK